MALLFERRGERTDIWAWTPPSSEISGPVRAVAPVRGLGSEGGVRGEVPEGGVGGFDCFVD